MSDPVRDTREAVDAARARVREEFEIVERLGRAHRPACIKSAMLNVDALIEAVLADERRETLARGDDATEARP
jgi:hypothetical protein